jgi:hypothetical protein
MVVGDLGRHPAMPPPSFWSKVHLRFNLLLCAGWSSGSIRGVGWEANVVRCLLIRSWMTVRDVEISKKRMIGNVPGRVGYDSEKF